MRKAVAATLAVLQLCFAFWLTLHTAAKQEENRIRTDLLLQNGKECLFVPLSLDLRLKDGGYRVFFTLTREEEAQSDQAPTYYTLSPEGREGVFTLDGPVGTPMYATQWLKRETLQAAVSAPHRISAEAGEALSKGSAFLPRLLIRNAWRARKKALSGALIVAKVLDGEVLFTGFTVKGETYWFEL